MAHIETWWRCPACNAGYSKQGEAIKCAVSHVRSERWAVGKGGKGVKIEGRMSEQLALIQADIDDPFQGEGRKEYERRKKLIGLS